MLFYYFYFCDLVIFCIGNIFFGVRGGYGNRGGKGFIFGGGGGIMKR